jgi:hypothetical protein
MTLILTVATGDKIVQASDRRLTYPDGSLYDDEANKAICVACQDSVFSIAYTGLGQIVRGQRTLPTDIWLAEILTDMRAGQMRWAEIARALRVQLEQTINQQRCDQVSKQLTLCLAGFHNGLPIIGTISNFQMDEVTILSEATESFQPLFRVPGPDAKKATYFQMSLNGATQAVGKPLSRRISKLRRQGFFHKAPMPAIASELVNLIRCASRTPGVGHVIGDSCMSVAFGPHSGFQCQYYSRAGGPQDYMPHAILQNASFWDIQLWLGPNPPPSWPKFR